MEGSSINLAISRNEQEEIAVQKEERQRRQDDAPGTRQVPAEIVGKPADDGYGESDDTNASPKKVVSKAELQNILEKHALYKQRQGGERANLDNHDLRGADLSGVDLRGAFLHNADLRGANLNGANLFAAFLNGARFDQASLKNTTLRMANLEEASQGKQPARSGLHQCVPIQSRLR